MPYVALAPATAQATAGRGGRARWDAILRAPSPTSNPPSTCSASCIGLVIDLADAHRTRPAAPAVAAAAVSGRQAQRAASRRWPASRFRCRSPLLKPVLLRFARSWRAAAPARRPTTSATRSDDGSLDAGSLLTASLARDQDAIRTGAAHRGLAPDLAVARRRAGRQPVRPRAAADAAARPTADAAGRCARRRPGELDARLLPGVRLLARARRSRRRPPGAALLVLRARLGAADVYACVYCGEGGERVRHGRARRGRGTIAALEVCGSCAQLPEDRRRHRAVAVSAARHRRSRNDGSRRGGDGARLSAARRSRTSQRRRRPSERARRVCHTPIASRCCRTPARCPCAGCCRARPS